MICAPKWYAAKTGRIMVMLSTQTPEPAATADETRKIFIVEDEEVTASYIRRQLEKLDYHVSGVAASGEKAITALEQHRSDLVLMDLKLAGELSERRRRRSFRNDSISRWFT
jgi:PleD family two-component response regulator